MSWNYRIWKKWDNYWIIEVYYKNKYKINFYTDFFHTWNSKQSILNSLKKLLKDNNNKNEDDRSIFINNSEYPYEKTSLRMMISDCLKKKVIDLDNIDRRLSRKNR